MIFPLLSAKAIRFASVLTNLEFELPQEEVFRIQGMSGSGKSSLLKTLVRATPHHHADLVFEGKPVGPCDIIEYRSRVHYVSQLLQTPDVTLHEFFAAPFCFRAHRPKTFDAKVAQNYLVRFGLDRMSLADPLRKLSGGELQRACLIRSLLLRPQVLLLDEPLSALDPETARQTVRELLTIHTENNPGWGLALVSHAELPTSVTFREKTLAKGRWVE